MIVYYIYDLCGINVGVGKEFYKNKLQGFFSFLSGFLR